uniref:Predicted protein n=1 Tax=Hordeum vulgare subsp. vulgare TaxID=112509 RepID=F2EAU4_HORVV|nr:predicted protein [Hordeum vulgare subsp. vulgare]
MSSLHRYLPCLILLVLGGGGGGGGGPTAVAAAGKVPAIIVFGDSSVDTGNNNFIPTIARSNFWPYGRDFADGHPTGRFSNGRLATDFISEAFGYFCSLSTSLLCRNANKYVFFDAIHPTERMYSILADKVMNTTLHVFL